LQNFGTKEEDNLIREIYILSETVVPGPQKWTEHASLAILSIVTQPFFHDGDGHLGFHPTAIVNLRCNPLLI